MDRVMCLDAFHHVHNPQHILAEMSRVLTPIGIAGFSEPGPNHSWTDQSQFEMKNYCVIENDIDMDQIWEWSKQVGFNDIQLSLHHVEPMLVSKVDFDQFLDGYDHNLSEYIRTGLANRRIFFLNKVEEQISDSRSPKNLAADIQAIIRNKSIRADQQLEVTIKVKNKGRSI